MLLYYIAAYVPHTASLALNKGYELAVCSNSSLNCWLVVLVVIYIGVCMNCTTQVLS